MTKAGAKILAGATQALAFARRRRDWAEFANCADDKSDKPAQVTVHLPEGAWLRYEAGKSYRIEIVDDEGGCVSVLRHMMLIDVVESGDDARLAFVQTLTSHPCTAPRTPMDD